MNTEAARGWLDGASNISESLHRRIFEQELEEGALLGLEAIVDHLAVPSPDGSWSIRGFYDFRDEDAVAILLTA
jgi:hypothetical protein